MDDVYKTFNHTIKFDTFSKPLNLYSGITDIEIALAYAIRRQQTFKSRLNQIKKGNKTEERRLLNNIAKFCDSRKEIKLGLGMKHKPQEKVS